MAQKIFWTKKRENLLKHVQLLKQHICLSVCTIWIWITSQHVELFHSLNFIRVFRNKKMCQILQIENLIFGIHHSIHTSINTLTETRKKGKFTYRFVFAKTLISAGLVEEYKWPNRVIEASTEYLTLTNNRMSIPMYYMSLQCDYSQFLYRYSAEYLMENNRSSNHHFHKVFHTIPQRVYGRLCHSLFPIHLLLVQF